MSFDYDKITEKGGQGDFWASYSDLFAVMSLIFLLLYVVASLRNGTSNIQNQMEYASLVEENKDLKQQMEVYNTLKDDYLQTGASQQEQKAYGQLMEKLSLLKEEAGREKEELRKAAMENEQKEKALNQYQKMVRNIINSNILSKANVTRRDRTITKKNTKIKDDAQRIKRLKSTVAKKESEIDERQKEIEDATKKLQVKVMQLKNAYMTNKITKSSMEKQIKELEENKEQKVAQLKAVNQKTKQELQEVSKVLQASNQELNQARQKLEDQSEELENLMAAKSRFAGQIENLQKQYDNQIEEAKEQFKREISKQKMSAAQKAQRLAELQKQAEAEQQQLANQIENLKSKANKIQNNLDKTLLVKNQLAEKAKDLEGQKSELSKDVKKYKEMANAKKKVIEKIKNNLARSGLKAEVDGRTGDVIISFGDEYFDSGKANLKPGMREIIEKFMPAYSKSLLSDAKLAEKISAVEIVGFASPTYKGKYVDPLSLEAESREAVNYNLDLSYYRAKSIFDYAFDTSKMKYPYQKKILSKIKVTGRSFLADGQNARDISSMSNTEYCKKFDCKKSQKVMIKFNMEP